MNGSRDAAYMPSGQNEHWQRIFYANVRMELIYKAALQQAAEAVAHKLYYVSDTETVLTGPVMARLHRVSEYISARRTREAARRWKTVQEGA